ncbi:MAG: site-2 protease family protein [Bryobacteraceae bacterium]
MSPEDYVSAPLAPVVGSIHVSGEDAQTPHRYWLHVLLLLATLLTTTIVGARMQQDFHANLPPAGVEEVWETFGMWWRTPRMLLDGLPFSLTLLLILLAHEFGHYLACVYYKLDASLPYFLPAPVLTGTFGAFIRIRKPIYRKRILFDVAVAGPVAGFVVLLPALAIGLAYSKAIPGIAEAGEFRFGTPALLMLLEKVIFPGSAVADVYLHPMARAAWIGLLATAWNLLPIGQLDGGHIIYSLVGERHKLLTGIAIAVLVVAGALFWRGWLIWAVLLFFGRRHPVIFDDNALGAGRGKLAWIALAIFLISFTIAPIEESSGL